MSLISKEMPAAVPGCVHLDLITAGVIRHPNKGSSELEQGWVGRTDFSWSNTIKSDLLAEHVGEDRVVEIVFDSIDTVAEIRLGGELLGSACNQFHPHRFQIQAGGGELEVSIAAPLDQLDELVARHGGRPVNADGAWGIYSYLRKSACAFGWDWGPMCPGSGLLGPVRIESYERARIESVRPLTVRCDERLAIVDVHVDVVRICDGDLGMRAKIISPSGRIFKAEVVGNGNTFVARLEIPDPERWWPRGHGAQLLHELQVEICHDEVPLDVSKRQIGLRSVELDQRDNGFEFILNGRRIFCRGANWIPDGLFPGTAPPQRIRDRIKQAQECGMNMLRVWGGGLYEQSVFYETCDRLGIMVWQDFMFACATYPEEPPYPALIEAEAEYQVARLSHHPSVVLWCGGNENVLAWRNWGWKERMPSQQTWGKRYFTELLPAICARLDPTRPYWPDSPWSGSVEADPNDPDCGDRHTWDLKLEELRQMVPRFASEFGHQSPPIARTIEEAVGRQNQDQSMALRQRAWGGDRSEYFQHLEKWFLPAATAHDRLTQMHLMQARATSLALEWLRANGTRCSGALLWQLNDAWAGHSWSLIDVAGRPKPSWWAAKHAFADQMLCIQPRGDALRAVAVNDGTESWQADARIRRMDFHGTTLAEQHFQLHVQGGGVGSVGIPEALANSGNPAGEFLLLEAGHRRATWFFRVDRQLEYPEPEFERRILPGDGARSIMRIEAHTFIRDLLVDVTRLAPDARVDENLISILPGEVRDVEIRGFQGVATADLHRPGLLFAASGVSSADE